LWGSLFWLPDGEWDGGADQFERAPLGRGGGGELVEVVAGGQLDPVAGEGGEVVEQPAEGVHGLLVLVAVPGGFAFGFGGSSGWCDGVGAHGWFGVGVGQWRPGPAQCQTR
jgi:hypothetical protein